MRISSHIWPFSAKLTSGILKFMSFTLEDITDVSSEINVNVLNTKYDNAIIVIQYGLTSNNLDQTLAFNESPIGVDNAPQALTANLTGLLPYKRYFFKIVAIVDGNVVAETSVSYFETLEPVELTDGNWVAMYDYTYQKNPAYTLETNIFGELRDSQYDCELGDELIPDPDLNVATGWTMRADCSIADGKMLFNEATTQRDNYRTYPNSEIQRLHRIELQGINLISEEAKVGCRLATVGIMLKNGSNVEPASAQQNGSFSYDVYTRYSTPLRIIVTNSIPYPTIAEIDYVSVKLIKGNHLLSYEYTQSYFKPRIEVTEPYALSFNFNDANLRQYLEAKYITGIGTIYGLVKKQGDEDYNFITSLDGIGGLDTNNNTLYLGKKEQNSGIEDRYVFSLKWLNIRTITDSQETVDKLTEWFLREDKTMPPIGQGNGIIHTGIWNDNALWDDSELWNDNN